MIDLVLVSGAEFARAADALGRETIESELGFLHDLGGIRHTIFRHQDLGLLGEVLEDKINPRSWYLRSDCVHLARKEAA